MKRLLISTALVLLLAASAGSAASLKSLMMVGPYAGYTVGLGDTFGSREASNVKSSSDAGLNFGGNVHYGLSDKMMIGGELYVQHTSYEEEGLDYKFSDSMTEPHFLFSALYSMNQMQRAMFLFNAGAGLYDTGESDLGLFGGVMYQRLVKRTMSLYLLARMHFIMAEETITMLQLAAGLQFWLGNAGAPVKM